jgi:uncharacterized protein (DUF1778 family)
MTKFTKGVTHQTIKLSVDADTLDQMRDAANHAGFTLSEWLEAAARNHLHRVSHTRTKSKRRK